MAMDGAVSVLGGLSCMPPLLPCTSMHAPSSSAGMAIVVSCEAPRLCCALGSSVLLLHLVIYRVSLNLRCWF